VGVWISLFNDTNKYKKFINLSSKKKYANVTKEKALNDFIKRKEYQIKILESKLKLTKTALQEAYKIKNQ
jgi:hypothetical protein